MNYISKVWNSCNSSIVTIPSKLVKKYNIKAGDKIVLDNNLVMKIYSKECDEGTKVQQHHESLCFVIKKPLTRIHNILIGDFIQFTIYNGQIKLQIIEGA